MAQSTKRKAVKPNLFETRDLIRLVQERRCLWDRSDQDYKDRSTKDAAWLQIYKTIEPDYDHFGEEIKNLIGSQITKKWYNVRDSYAKAKKHYHRRPYIYAKMLTFLDDVYVEDKEKADESESGEQWLNEVFIPDEEGEAKKPKLSPERTDRENDLMTMLTSLLQREEDEDRAFFRSITPAVKKLSEESKMEFKIQVMNLLKSLSTQEKTSCVVKTEVDNRDF